ncbi:MAG: DUF2155 domain-containing protein [Pseudomonadota bacterium]
MKTRPSRSLWPRVLLAALLTVPGISHAQETVPAVDESRAIIPRAKIIRVPSLETDIGEVTETLDDPSLEVRPLEPLEGSSSGGGVAPVGEEASQASDLALQDGTPIQSSPQIRVVTPGQDDAATDADTSDEQPAETSNLIQTVAVTPADDGRPGWQRERTKRFKLAPKGEEKEEDTDRLFAVPINPIQTGLKTGARIRQLDKMTGQTVTYDLANGESRRVDRLLVALQACRSPENNASHGAMAFLKIWDTREIGGDPDFTGWMFADSPALSSLDHPRYDLWVISCTTSEADVSTVSE